jgi:AraC-like DNA-binding protein
MNHLKTGQFHGMTSQTILMDGLTLTDTEYTHNEVDWHYHENAYFTFILQGSVIEGNKKEIYNCTAGSLLFHNWQEPHYNVKPDGFTRGFHIELDKHWVHNSDFNFGGLTGSINIQNPDLKLLLYNIFRETKIKDETSALSIQSLLLQLLSQMLSDNISITKKKPNWVPEIRDILNDTFSESLTLSDLSGKVDIHPVHLSRDFQKYFHCSLGQYIRKLKIQKSMSLLPQKETSLSDITFECGFADQSHFNRCFKEIIGITPFAYRKLMLA